MSAYDSAHIAYVVYDRLRLPPVLRLRVGHYVVGWCVVGRCTAEYSNVCHKGTVTHSTDSEGMTMLTARHFYAL